MKFLEMFKPVNLADVDEKNSSFFEHSIEEDALSNSSWSKESQNG